MGNYSDTYVSKEEDDQVAKFDPCIGFPYALSTWWTSSFENLAIILIHQTKSTQTVNSDHKTSWNTKKRNSQWMFLHLRQSKPQPALYQFALNVVSLARSNIGDI